MGDTITQQEGQKSKKIKRLIDIVLALTLVGGVVIGVKTVMSDMDPIERTKTSSEEELSSKNSSSAASGDIIYSSELKYNEDVNIGPLIVVNDKNEYKGTDSDLVSMYDVKDDDGTESYLVMSADVKLHKEAANALNDMLKAFADETKHTDIVVDGGYRSIDYQQELYDAAEDKESAAKPGYSDYHAGCSIDLGIQEEDDDTVGDFDGTGDYDWFEKNSYKYGYVVRYPEGKKDSTGYDYRPWHFRYVGKVHAYYMVKNNLSLEEYVDKLKTFEYTQTHLIFEGDDGQEYEVYYFPSDTSSDSTMVAVPSENEYQISGNNSDGFIVSFDKNQKKAAEESKSGEESKDSSADEKKDKDNDKSDSSSKSE